MKLFGKPLLILKSHENIISHLVPLRINILSPKDYSEGNSSEFTKIYAESNSETGTRYLYIYPKAEYVQSFTDGTLAIESDVSVTAFGATTKRFGIALSSVATGQYTCVIYDTKTNKTVFKLTLDWKNNSLT